MQHMARGDDHARTCRGRDLGSRDLRFHAALAEA
jgi:hypothetical protein